MQQAIDLLEGHAKHRRQFYSETASPIHLEYAAEYTRAASILRSYPQSVEEPEAKPAEPEPRTKTLGDTIADGLNELADKLEAEFRDVAVPAPTQAERLTAAREEHAASDEMPTPEAMRALKGQSDEPIALESTPPEMQDDPRYLHIWVTTLETMMFGATKDLVLNAKAEEAAIATFNALFPKP